MTDSGAAALGAEAVLGRAGAGPLLVVGGPGSGKTTLIAEVASRALARRTPGEAQPLVLTFSRRAASELRNRIARQVGRTIEPPLVMTLHALCLWLTRRSLAPGQAMPRLLTAPEQEFRVRELLLGRGPGAWPAELAEAIGTRAFARQVRAVLARARHLGQDPEDVVAAGVAAGRPEWVSVGHFFDEYLDVLDHEGSLDYAELVHRARILLTDPAVLAAVRGEVSQVLVDEYQECDPAQIGLLRALVPGGGPVLAAGDPDQAVFRFRGAHPRALAEFPMTFAGPDGAPAPVFALTGSHRAGAGLQAVWAGVSRRLPLPVLGAAATAALRPEPAPPGQDAVRVAVCASESEQAGLIAEELRRAQLDEGMSFGEMAVLVRSGRRQLAPIARALVAAGIPVEVAGDEIPLMAEQAVRPLLLALEVVQRGLRLDADEAKRLLTSPLVGLEAVGLRALGRLLLAAEAAEVGMSFTGRSALELLADALVEPARLAPLPPSAEVDAVRGCAALLEAAAEVLARPGSGSAEVLWSLWSGTGWPQALQRASAAGGEAGRRADRDLDAVLALFTAARASEQPPGPGGVRGFLAEVAAQEIPADTTREAQVVGRGVRLLTVHRAKGRQWPLVVVAGVQEGLWPDLDRGTALLDPEHLVSAGLLGHADPRARLAEERRLFLVACSRSRRRLLVTAVNGAEGEGNQPSRFLAELGVPVQVHTPSERLLSLPSLVASLRRTAASVDCSPALREAAALRLARLAELADAAGHPLVPAADPSRWWGVLEPTAATPSADGRVRLSATKLTSLLACPRQYFLSRKANADPPRSTATSLGSVIHVLAEHARTDGLTADELSGHLADIWEEIPFEAAWMSSSERVQAEQVLTRFLRWQDVHAEADVIGAEVPFEADLQVDGTTVTLSGVVDRLERTADGRLRVVDFKTGRSAPTAAQVAAHEQLGLYQLAIEAGGFDRVAGPCAGSAGGMLVYLRHSDGDDDWPRQYHQAALAERPHLTEADQGHPSWAHRQVASAVAVVRAGRYPATPGGACRWCPYAQSCPAQPGGRQVLQ